MKKTLIASIILLSGCGGGTTESVEPANLSASVAPQTTVEPTSVIPVQTPASQPEVVTGIQKDGPMGPQGPKGDTGPMGPKGEKGDTGAQGIAGPAGRDGIDGSAGLTLVKNECVINQYSNDLEGYYQPGPEMTLSCVATCPAGYLAVSAEGWGQRELVLGESASGDGPKTTSRNFDTRGIGEPSIRVFLGLGVVDAEYFDDPNRNYTVRVSVVCGRFG